MGIHEIRPTHNKIQPKIEIGFRVERVVEGRGRDEKRFLFGVGGWLKFVVVRGCPV
jgi:hypothetical protein